eukprot:scaffold540_cov118-Skeletonema_dohrnii-CCMP3373.AAC.2
MKLSLIITVLFAGEAIAGDNLRANVSTRKSSSDCINLVGTSLCHCCSLYPLTYQQRDDKRERRLAKSPKVPKRRDRRRKYENVKEATPWKQNVAWIATADDNAATMARGSWWLLMTLPMLYLN